MSTIKDLTKKATILRLTKKSAKIQLLDWDYQRTDNTMTYIRGRYVKATKHQRNVLGITDHYELTDENGVITKHPINQPCTTTIIK